MSYHTMRNLYHGYNRYHNLGNTCENVTNPNTTNNSKYNTPFYSTNVNILYYPENHHKLNSFEYNNNNLYPCSKSYENVDKAYTHFVTELLQYKDKLLQEEKELTEKQNKNVSNKNSNVSPTEPNLSSTQKLT